MTSLPNPFNSAASDAAAEQAVASISQPQPLALDAAADLSDSGEPVAPSPDDAAAPFRQVSSAAADIQSSCGDGFADLTGHQAKVGSDQPADVGAAPGPQEAIDCIGEIFAGARKLEQPGPFDPTAYTAFDEVMYEALRLLDDPRARDRPYLPDPRAFMDEIEPLPLFLRTA